MSSRFTSDDSRAKRPYLPQPSLHIGIMRSDPWNEFLEHRPVTADELLKFTSTDGAMRTEVLRDRINDQLTTIAGPGAPPPPPVPILPDMSGLAIDMTSVTSMLFSRAVLPEPVTADPTVGPAIPATNPSEISPESALPAAEASKSIWDRASDAWENIRKTTSTSLPSWFSNEQSLVVPTDPEIRKILGSIYGGAKTRVVVTVRVIEATDVPVLDWWGTSDPYVSVCLVRGVGGLSAGRLDLLPTIGGLKSSSPRFATLNPKWNESVQLDPADLLSIISDSVLHVSMWDKDIVKSDDPVGFTTVSLIDSLQCSGVSPYPILPIQITGSLIGPHAGVFVKVQLRMVQKVGCVSLTPIALQGFTRGWGGYSIRLEAKITKTDPIASPFYVGDGLCQPEASPPALVNETGHAVWGKNVSPITLLFSTPAKAKPYLHITLKSDAASGDAGQIAIRIGMLERLGGIAPLRLSPLDGSPDPALLGKCALYCGVECELVD